IPGIRQASEALQGFIGFDPRYSVMDPEAESLASAYRGGESASVISDLVGALSPFAYASAMSKASQIPGMAELIAYHGSPHKFKKFDASKIGTGEGAQAFGHGLYFAEAPEVAEGYARNLANRDLANQGRLNAHANAQRLAKLAGDPKYAADDIRFVLSNEPNHPQKRLLQDTLMFLESGDFAKPLQTKGSLYKVDIPNKKIAQMLDWDKPLSQQPEAVQKIAKEYGLTKNASGTGEAKGSYIYQSLAIRLAQPPFNEKNPFSSGAPVASERLRELGIPGIRYLDQRSRGDVKGTSNFVVFPGEEDSIKMLEINNAPPMKKGGAVHISDNPDTMLLELMKAPRFQDGGGIDFASVDPNVPTQPEFAPFVKQDR
ncbi:MAG: hypothetical protein EBR82_85290, partial [Caulobacteraceae bacterium]|nr:hypothetical protein [Caulobacteraceae bacterium]